MIKTTCHFPSIFLLKYFLRCYPRGWCSLWLEYKWIYKCLVIHSLISETGDATRRSLKEIVEHSAKYRSHKTNTHARKQSIHTLSAQLQLLFYQTCAIPVFCKVIENGFDDLWLTDAILCFSGSLQCNGQETNIWVCERI